MNFNNLLIFCIFTSFIIMEALALKRIKRNSLGDTKNPRIQQDFVMLNTKNHENFNTKALSSYDISTQSSANASQTHASRLDNTHNAARPLAVILSEREHKLNEYQKGASRKGKDTSAEKENYKEKFEKFEKSKNVQDRHHIKKHSPKMLHATSVLSSHKTYGDLSPFAPLDQLMRFGNMMMFKVGLASSPSLNTFSDRMLMSQNSLKNPQRNIYQAINEPNYDYVFNSFEQPEENYFNLQTPIESKSIILKPSLRDNKPSDLANLMQTALDTFLTKSANNIDEIELSCPIHNEKKSINTKENDEGDIIQVCSCRFIKNHKDEKQQNK